MEDFTLEFFINIYQFTVRVKPGDQVIVTVAGGQGLHDGNATGPKNEHEVIGKLKKSEGAQIVGHETQHTSNLPPGVEP